MDYIEVQKLILDRIERHRIGAVLGFFEDGDDIWWCNSGCIVKMPYDGFYMDTEKVNREVNIHYREFDKRTLFFGNLIDRQREDMKRVSVLGIRDDKYIGFKTGEDIFFAWYDDYKFFKPFFLLPDKQPITFSVLRSNKSCTPEVFVFQGDELVGIMKTFYTKVGTQNDGQGENSTADYWD